MARHHGRQPSVPGGYPHAVEIRLTEDDRKRLAVAAAHAELADGAFASQAVHRVLTAADGDSAVPADWRGVMLEQLRHRAALAQLHGEVAAAGRLLNQIARAVNANGTIPDTAALTRAGNRITVVLDAVEHALADVDELTARARERL